MTGACDHRRFLLFATLIVTAVTAAPAQELKDRQDPLPDELVGVGIDEKLNNQLPLDAVFTDQDGKSVKLRDYFDGQHPVLLTLNYYRCPMLCGLQINGMLDAMKELAWTAGDEYRVLTVSFDPLETRELAYEKRRNYLKEYGRPAAGRGWSFLTGSTRSIESLLDATGFHIRFDKKRGEWVHAAAIMVCTPDGRLSRYLRGVLYDPKTVRLSLVEASEGKIGSTVDDLLLFCFHYDAAQGRYSLRAMNLVRLGGGLCALGLGVWLIYLFRRERRPREVTTPT